MEKILATWQIHQRAFEKANAKVVWPMFAPFPPTEDAPRGIGGCREGLLPLSVWLLGFTGSGATCSM